MFKKISVLLIAFFLTGCSSVIYERSENTTYDYKLYFENEDIDESYSDEEYIDITGDEDITINTSGTYVLSGKLNGSVIINSNGKVKLVLDGVTINSDDFAAIYIKECDKCTITLKDGSENVLSDSSTYTLMDDNNVDAVIFSKCDLVFNGTGKLTVNASYKHGIVSKDELTFINGTYDVTSVSQGICGKDCLKVKDGTFTINSTKDALKSNNEEEGRGYIYITGGTFNISTSDDAITAYHDLIIDGGEINITNSYEGLEASVITINDGNISIHSQDDCINAASKEDDSSTLKINGGTIYLNSEGDGIDSNGDVYITGGTIFVEGPVSGGDAAFDYETAAYISGGDILMIGQSSMAEGFNEDGSSQVSLLYNMTSSYFEGSTLKILVNDEVLYDTTISKQFNSILVSSPSMEIGDVVTIQVNDDTYTYTLESTSNTYGNSGMNGGGIGGPNDDSFDPNNSEMDGQQPPDNSDMNGEKPDMGDFDGQTPPDKEDSSEGSAA